MAINIKELFNADADNIKVDKTNYNFDQILANGGGPVGAKGNSGTTGNTGVKGVKGEVGNKGNEGNKGEQGTSANLWDVDSLTTVAGDADVLRPFNNDGANPDLRTRLILGQDTTTAANTTPTEPAALLNLVLPPETNNDTTSQIIFINDEGGNPREFKMATDYELGTGSTFTFSALAATNGEKTNLAIQMPNEITLDATDFIRIGTQSTIDVDITANNSMALTADADFTLISPEIMLSGTNSYFRIRANGNAELITNGGDIDIQSDSTASGSVIIRSDLSYDPTAVVYGVRVGDQTLATQVMGRARLKLSSTQTNSIVDISAGTSGTILMSVGAISASKDKLEVSETITTHHQTSLFDQAANVIDQTTSGLAFDDGHGIQTLEGGNYIRTITGFDVLGLYKAPNYGSNTSDRTLSDYYHNPNYTGFNIMAMDTITTNLYVSNSSTAGSTGNLLTAPTGLIYSTLAFSASSINSKAGSYIKIGDMVHGHGVMGATAGSTWDTLAGANRQLNGSLKGMSLFIDLSRLHVNGLSGDNDRNIFPYTNSSAAPVMCDVMISGNSSGSATEIAPTGEFPHLKGIIYPGGNSIYLFRGEYRTGDDKILWRHLSPKDMYGSTGTSFEISFKFSFPTTNVNSYNREYLFEQGFNISDRNLKTNIVKIGESQSGYNIYQFNFIDNLPEYVIESLGGGFDKDTLWQGVIADELPSRFVKRYPGEDFDRVAYDQIDVEFKVIEKNV